MEAGNPKQVAVLSVIALAALGYLGKGMIHGAAPLVAASAGGSSASANSKVKEESLMLAFDPFSHVKMTLAKQPGKPTEDKPASPPAPTGPPSPAPLVGSLPVPMTPMGPLSVEAPTIPGTSAKTEPKPAPATTLVSVEAVVAASDRVVFLAVDGADSRPFKTKDRVKGPIRVLRIDDGTVLLSGPKGELTLSVGEQKRI